MESPMIRGHVSLLRQLKHLVEGSGFNWADITPLAESIEDGSPVFDADRLEVVLRHNGQKIHILLIRATQDRIAGMELLPCGKLAARFESGETISGINDPAVWAKIAAAIRATAAVA
jgi:hypothetical protein